MNRCNCPLDQDEKQLQLVGNVTKMLGNHTFKFGVDVRRAYNLRVPSDAHRSGELTFTTTARRSTGGGGLGLATFLLGDVTRFPRYVSANTDARERQWRHFYYAQDTWRVNSKTTLNYGLRLDVINPQTINEPGNAGFLDLDTGEIGVVGVGDVPLNGDVENNLNWAPRLGATYQLDEKTVLRGGYGRSLRHRRVRLAVRPQRDAEPAGALGSGAERAVELRLRVHARAGTVGAVVPGRAVERAGSRCRTACSPRAARAAAAADGRRLQRHAAATADDDDVGRGGLRRQPRPRRVRR